MQQEIEELKVDESLAEMQFLGPSRPLGSPITAVASPSKHIT